MNLLFVLSQIELTGAESYAVSLIKELIKRGYKTGIVSDTLTSQIAVPYYPLDLDNRGSLINRLRHITSLIKIIKQMEINLVHAHSRASSWAAYFASCFCRIPLVTTAHCIYPVHLSRILMPCFGQRIIAVCGAVKQHLIRDLKITPGDISLIPNGIDMSAFKPKPVAEGLREELCIQAKQRVVSWIGRFSGPRGRLIEGIVENVLPEVSRAIQQLSFLIVADGERPASLVDKVKTLNHQFGREVIKFTGLRKDVPQICNLSDLIIGAGRVALEAMACARPVIAIGENRLIGLLNPQTIEDGIYTNFGDCCPKQIVDWKSLTQSIIEILQDKDRANQIGRWGREITLSQFDLQKVVNQVEEVYHGLVE